VSIEEDDFERKGWLEERQQGLGGSDAAAALGLSPWKSPLALYMEKIGEAKPLTDTEPLIWGRALEPAIRREYERRTGLMVTKPAKALVHEQHRFMRANLDGVAVYPTPRVVEIKTARTDKGWGEPGSDDVPQAYLLQCVHYMIVTGAQLADIAVLIGGQDFRVYTIHRNRQLDELVIDGERVFWDAVQQRTPPEARTLEEINLRWRESRARSIELPQDAADALRRLVEIRGDLADVEAEAERCEAAIKAAMEDADTATVDGVLACTWKQARASQVFDRDRFKVEFPEMYQQYQTERAGSRRFLVKG
jgi:putative phage-type endonuclease